MKRPHSSRCDPFALLIAILAGLGTAHILVRTATYGPTITWDATVYLSTAMNVLAGEGWRDFAGYPLVTWPPLFPLLLAAGGWVGIEPLEAGRWVNATAFGLTILAAGGWLRSHLRARWLVLAATGAIAASLPLSEFASSLMTEPLFVLFALLALIQLASFYSRGGRTSLLLGAVSTALAALTRYPGVVLIGVGVLLLLVRRTPPLTARLKDAVVFGAISSLPLAGVLTRNWTISGTLTGKRGASGQSLSDGLCQIGEVFRAWVVPSNGLDGLGYLLWTAAGLVGVAGVVVGGSRLFKVWQVAGKGSDGVAARGLGPALPFGVFALTYLVFMVAVVPFTVHQGIDSRYLLPVYVPLLLAAALLLDRFLSLEAAGRMAVAKWGLASLVLLGGLAHVSLSAYENLRITSQREPDPSAVRSPHWHHSETLKYIRTHLSDSRTFSKNSYLIWFWNRSAAPGKYQYLPYKIHKVIPYIHRKTQDDSAHIVWLQPDLKPWYSGYDDLDLRVLPGVETVAELADGVVFRVTTAEPFEPFDAQRHRARKQRYLQGLIQQAGEPVVRADWDVYRTGRRLIYVKQPCAPADTQAKFVLHVTPADPGVLSRSRQRYGFDNLDFYFDPHGLRVGDQCMAAAHLPGYAIDRIYTGQWISAENRTLWDAEFAGGGG